MNFGRYFGPGTLEAVERTDHLYRDTFRGIGLCALGRTALGRGDRMAAIAAFRQATLHLRGRPRARGGGSLLVQALAGSTRTGDGPAPFDEAMGIFARRGGWNFRWMVLCSDDVALLELARAARALGRTDQARELRERAIDCGATEALGEEWR